jgi:dipeptidyl aminopeptidase/acylaminoacyl peptidase
MRIIRPITLALCSIASMSGLATPGSCAPAQQSAGYTVDDFLGSTFISQIEVSPAGRWVAFITNRDDFTTDRTDIAVWVIDVSADDSQKSPLRLTTEPGEYSRLQWSPDERTLAVWSRGMPGGAASIILFDSRNAWRSTTVASPTEPGGIVTYAWAPGASSLAFVSAVPLDSSAGAATSPLSGEVAQYSKAPLHHWQLYRADVHDGQLTSPHLLASLSQAPREITFSPDSRKLALLVVNNILLMPADGSAPPLPVIAHVPWQHIDGDLRWTPQGMFARGYGEFSGGDYLRTQRRLFRILPESGTVLVVGSAFRGEWLAYAPVSDGSLLGVGQDGLTSNIYAIANGASNPALVSARNAGIGAMGASANGHVIAYAASDSTHFTELYVARGIGKLDQVIRVTSLNQLLDEEPKPETEVVRWPNGDGDHIEGVLYWPPGKRGMKRLPTIIVLHGGPQQGVAVALAESSAPFANYPALLASRGYLVLYPAFRGTTGFGDKFMQAVDDARCSRPSKDVMSGVDYLVSNGWADPATLGIMGTSFGGTTTDCVIGRTTEFRAAVSSEGSFDGISASGEHASSALLMARRPSSRPTPYNDHEHFWSESAIGNATRIRTPTLIDRGGKDDIVNPSQSEELATALAADGVPYRLLLFPGEGHMFARPADKRLKLEAEIAWMDHYLLGRPLP